MRNVRRRAAIALALAACIAAIAWWLHDRGGAAADAPAGPRDRVAIGKTAAGPLDVRRARIAGTVVLDGAPLPGATVRLRDQRVATDAAGRFDLGLQPIAVYVVIAEAPHLTGAAVAVDLADPLVPADHVKLVLHACDASLHGTIRDVGGGAIAGARVMHTSGTVDSGPATESAADGSYELCVPVGGGLVVVSAEGYAQVVASGLAYGRVRRDFALGPEAIVIGKVERAVDHAPVAGAQIELHRGEHDRSESPIHVTALSDAGGQFRITGVAPARYLASATADHLATAQPAAVIAEVGAHQPVTIVLSPAVAVRGKVVERAGHAPVAGVAVAIWSNRDEATSTAITRPDGSFAIEPVRPGTYSAAVDAYELVTTSSVAVGTNDVDGLVLEVEALASIAGRVTRGGKPVDGAMVRADNHETHADADGRYTLQGMRAGNHRMYAESQRLGAFSHGPTIELGAAEHKTGVDLELDLDAAIAGTVVDQNDAPVAGVVVRFSLIHGTDSGIATTAEDGSFAAKALAGGGDYVYDVRPAAVTPITYPPVHGRRFLPIAVRDAHTQVTGVRIAIRVEHLAIAGRVLATTGAPLPDVVVRAQTGLSGAFDVASATTDVTGAFALRDLRAGSYTVRATSPRGDERVPDVAAGRSDLVIRLPEPGAIEGTIDGLGAGPRVFAFRFDKASAPIGDYDATVAGNAFALRDLPPGRYSVQATSDQGQDSADVTVAAGATVKLALRGRGFAAIEGRVVDAAHQPVVGIQCSASVRSPADVTTDATGAFRIDGAFAGDNVIVCSSGTALAVQQLTLVGGQTSHVDLVAESHRPQLAKLGMELEDELGQVIVQSVEPGGAAAKAGIAISDVIVELDGHAISSSWALRKLPPGTTARLALERGDQSLTVSLTVP